VNTRRACAPQTSNNRTPSATRSTILRYTSLVKRLRRIILNALTFLSLLLCVASIWLWIHSHSTMDVFRRWDANRRTEEQLMSCRGKVRIAAYRFVNSPVASLPSGVGWQHVSVAAALTTYSLDDPRRHLGFYFSSRRETSPDYGITLTVPDWFLAVFTGLLPAARGFRWFIRRRRAIPGTCPRCGYDLRATPDRCPECGAEPPLGD
jgi:hypothetical protein